MYSMLILFLAISIAGTGSNAFDPSTCDTFSTTQYDYNVTDKHKIEEITYEGEIYLAFYVKAERDAHIIFSPKESPVKLDEVAYEIVLGASADTISYIRNIRYSGNQGKFYKPVLSKEEWLRFWIRIDSNGFIQVGRGFEENSFLNWTDPNRLSINHYAFSSWDNEVKWALNCSEDWDTLLKNHLSLSNRIITAPKNATVTFISRSAKVNDVFFVINGSINMTWKDSSLRWSPREYKVNELQVDHAQVEPPNITILNKQILDSGTVTITQDGAVSWTTSLQEQLPSPTCLPRGNSPYKLLVRCEVNLTYFPESNVQFNFLNDQSNGVGSTHFLSRFELNSTDEHKNYIFYERRN